MKGRAGWLSVIAVGTVLATVLAIVLAGGRKERHRSAYNDAVTTVVVAVATPPPRRIAPTVEFAAAGVEGTDRPIPGLTFAGDLHRDVCACSDRTCLDAVNERYRALAGRQAPMAVGDEAAYLAISRSTRPCVQRILDAEASGHDN